MEECKCPKCGYKFVPEENEEEMMNEQEQNNEEMPEEPFAKNKSSLAIIIGKAMPKKPMKK